MSDDLVKRLRDLAYEWTECCDDIHLPLSEAADRIEELEAKLAKAVDAGIGVAASLTAAISLLERGGKKAAPSDKMFAQMLVDYSASLDRARATLAKLKGGKNE